MILVNSEKHESKEIIMIQMLIRIGAPDRGGINDREISKDSFLLVYLVSKLSLISLKPKEP